MKLNFQQDALVIPGAVLGCCADADAAAMRVLLWIASDPSLPARPRQLAKLADCDLKALKAILHYWKMYGILMEDSEEQAVPAMAQAEAVEEKKKKPLVRRADELPQYTSTELAELMEQRQGVREMVDEAQRVLGKMFNPSEVNILLGMLDYLSIEEEAILLLLAYCKRIGKTNMRSIEKLAYTLSDKGVCNCEQMEEELRVTEAMHTFEGEVRSLFGMKARALTSRESKMLSAWVSFGYDIEIVRMAYEATVNATGEASVAYANAILERWNAEGLRTCDEIRAALEAEQAKKETVKANKNGGKAEKTGFGNSFDTDDLFEAALKRSFSDRRED